MALKNFFMTAFMKNKKPVAEEAPFGREMQTF
jgi:hypothetical protein